MSGLQTAGTAVSDASADSSSFPNSAVMNAPGGWLFVLPWSLTAPGGVSQVVQNLLNAAPRHLNMPAQLLVSGWGHAEPITQVEMGRSTTYMTVQEPFDPNHRVKSLLTFVARLPLRVLRLRRLLVERGITQVHVHYPGLSALVWLLVRGVMPWPLRVVLTFHGSDLRTAKSARGLERSMWSALLRHADDVTACAEPLRRELKDAFPAASRARTVGNGVDPEFVQRAADTATPPPDLPARFVLCLATFERKKGIDVLLKAFDTIAEHHPDLSLVLAGRLGEADHFAELDALRARMVHGQRVRFLVGLPHATAMATLARARALVLPSRIEPFGLVVLEAGLLGVPVVASTACGVAQLLDAGREFESVPPDDAQALASALGKLLEDTAGARRLADALRQRVFADFTWDRIVGMYQALPGSEYRGDAPRR